MGEKVKPLLPLCWALQSADSRFTSATITRWGRAGEQGRSGPQREPAGMMREGQGEGQGDRCGEAMGDAALDEVADLEKMEHFS